MSDGNTPKLTPPSSWEKFEEACADLFARLWQYPQVVRYGRQGQRQDGVDIYGHEAEAHAAVQCKEKKNWPPKKLTKSQVDTAVREAKKFRPKLRKFYIVTTAENDKAITDHANAITEEHSKNGLFKVHIYGWSELVRRFQDHPDLIEKHFDSVVIRKIQSDIQDVRGAIEQVIRRTQTTAVAGEAADDSNLAWKAPLPADKLGEAVERDLSSRFKAAFQRSMYPEQNHSDEFLALADEVLASRMPVSAELAQTVLFRGARAAAIKGKLDDARRYLQAGQSRSGNVSSKPALARLSVAEGDVDAAIRLLRDDHDAECRSVLLSVIAAKDGDEAALRWMHDHHVQASALSSLGLLNLAQLHMRLGQIEKAVATLDDATADQLADGPYLHLIRGALRFANLFATPDQPVIFLGLPMDMRIVRPTVEASELAKPLDKVLNDLREALPLARTLGLREAPRLIEAYILWCELLHPSRQGEAREKLLRDMQDPRLAVGRVELAFIVDIDFATAELEAHLQRRDRLGGWTDDELRAAIALRLNTNDAEGIAAIIAAKREQAEASFGKVGIRLLEVQALAKSGEATSARIVLDENRDLFNAGEIAMLEAEVAKAEGADPVVEHLRLYEQTKAPEALRAFVGQLHAKRDHVGVARYAEQLFNETKDFQALGLAAEAVIRAGRGSELVRLVEAHPKLRAASKAILRHYGWQLLYLGRLKKAAEVAAELQQGAAEHRDLNLEVAIALETGEWEELASPLAAALQPGLDLSGLDLIRSAHLSQASGQGALNDLIRAALDKAPDDPQVLMGAYTLHVEEGLEEQGDEAHLWFRKALALSGPDGPVQAVELKDILSQQTSWNERVQHVTRGMTRGELPLVVAGPALRTTVVDVVLRNLVRNTALSDARRRVAVPLFSGRRLPEAVTVSRRAAFDLSSLLVLGWLGILPAVFALVDTIVLPAGALTELFEGRRRIRRFQASRLRKAIEVRAAIADQKLKVVRTPTLLRDPVVQEIGEELAALLRVAEAENGFVLRPAPVHRLGTAGDQEANMSSHAGRLCDMHSILRVLADRNAVDQETEKVAKRYFDMQDKAWPASPSPDPAKPLLVDGLSLHYIQYTGLLPALFHSFKDVRIHSSTEDDAKVLIEHDHHAKEVLRVIDDIRQEVRKANAAGRIVFGPKRQSSEPREPDENQSTINLISDLSQADVVVIDDRALNKESFAADESGHRLKLISTLDLIETLHARQRVSDEQRHALRYRLRTAGAALMPVDAAELTAAVRKNRQAEAPEFRAIHQSLSLARLSEMPQFPSEMQWFMSYTRAARSAIFQIWNEENDVSRAKRLAEAIMSIGPQPDDWADLWRDVLPPGWAPAVQRALLAGLAMPFEIHCKAKVAEFNEWFEASVLSGLRQSAPRAYENVVQYLRQFIASLWDDDDGRP